VLVAAAGPASNVVLALVSAGALALLPVSPVTLGEPNLSVPVATMLARALQLNVLLAVFNMIPVPPLDGGNVLGGLLPLGIASRFDKIIRPYGFIVLYAIVLTPAFDYLVWKPTSLILSWLR
jgi:Zn-dependent protease